MSPNPGPGLAKCKLSSTAILSAVLNTAMIKTSATAADVAKWTGVHERTVQSWQAARTPVAVEKVMLSKRLYPLFLRALQEAHEAVHFVGREAKLLESL